MPGKDIVAPTRLAYLLFEPKRSMSPGCSCTGSLRVSLVSGDDIAPERARWVPNLLMSACHTGANMCLASINTPHATGYQTANTASGFVVQFSYMLFSIICAPGQALTCDRDGAMC